MSQEAVEANLAKVASINWAFGGDDLLHGYNEQSKKGIKFELLDELMTDLYKKIQILFIDNTNRDWEKLSKCFELVLNSIRRLTINYPIDEAGLAGYIGALNFVANMPCLTYLELRNLEKRIAFKSESPKLTNFLLTNSAIPLSLICNDKLKISKDAWKNHKEIEEFAALVNTIHLKHQAYENIPANYEKDPIEDLTGISSILMQSKYGNLKYVDTILKRLASNMLDWIKKQIVANVNQSIGATITDFSHLGENKASLNQLMIDACDIDEPKEEVDAILEAVKSLRLLKIVTTNANYYKDLLGAANEQTDLDITLKFSYNSAMLSQTYVSRPKKLLETDSLDLSVFNRNDWTHVKLNYLSHDFEDSQDTLDLEAIKLKGFRDAQYIVMHVNDEALLKSFISEAVAAFKGSYSEFPQLQAAMAGNEDITIAMPREGEDIEVVIRSLISLKNILALIPIDQRHYRINFNWRTDVEDLHINDSGFFTLKCFIAKLTNAVSIHFTGDIHPFFSFLNQNFASIKQSGIFEILTELDHIRIDTAGLYEHEQIAAVRLFPAETILLNGVESVILTREVTDMLRKFREDSSPDWNIVEECAFSSSFTLSKKSAAPYTTSDRNSRLLVEELEKKFTETKTIFNFSGETTLSNQEDADMGDLK